MFNKVLSAISIFCALVVLYAIWRDITNPDFAWGAVFGPLALIAGFGAWWIRHINKGY